MSTTEKCKNCYNKCFLKECACGCGYIITDRDSNNRLRRFRIGHPSHPFRRYKAEKHYNWKGGKKHDTRGYLMIRIGVRKYVAEHRIVMEKALGRQLLSNERIHHKNGIKDDNHLENLEITTLSEHMIIHHTLGSFEEHYDDMRKGLYKRGRNKKGQFL